MLKKHWGKILLVLFVMAGLMAAALCSFVRKSITPQPPQRVSSVSLYDRNGVPVREFLAGADMYTKPVSLDKISPWLVLALVAVEDKRFFSHSGVDFKAVTRAAFQNISAGQVVSGASTITQQLVRNIEPRPKNLISKAKEAISAFFLENKLDKYQILEEYFNTVEFSNMVQGAEAASRYYFNVSAQELSLSQAAFLAAMVKSPSRYNPLKNFDAALERRDSVLKKMFDNGLVTEENYLIALAEKIDLSSGGRAFSAPHLAQYIIDSGNYTGAEVTLTIDSELQNYVQDIVKTYISKLKPNNVTNAAVIVADNKTGEVLAYVGSADYFNTEHSGAVNGAIALRQPGSALKPFVYAIALEDGTATPATLIKDDDTFFTDGFRPKNYDESFHGEVSLRRALASSYNVPVVRVAEQVGENKILAVLHRLGFDSLSKSAEFYGLGISLGNGEVRLTELVRAYMVLANGGVYRDLRYTIPAQRVQRREVFSPQTAYLITNILSDNDARADAFGVNSPLYQPFGFAAKTGTSKDYRDNWAAGYTDRWTIGVWAGNFNGEPMRKVSGISGAAPILKDVAAYMQKHYPSKEFSQPHGIEKHTICLDTGFLPDKNCKHFKEEVFNSLYPPPARSGETSAGAKVLLKKKESLILFPQDGDVFKIDPSFSSSAQKIIFKASTSVNWSIDGKAQGAGPDLLWQLSEGEHEISAAAGNEKESIKILVLK
ncbi:penicillin-binding protein 1C [Elusimicrobium posterum]|uniref:penicillin-binding protein 1C n=1 Tax=Elusimicrobium posterum TaxID=3116653 RepID=UPI003C7901AB